MMFNMYDSYIGGPSFVHVQGFPIINFFPPSGCPFYGFSWSVVNDYSGTL